MNKFNTPKSHYTLNQNLRMVCGIIPPFFCLNYRSPRDFKGTLNFGINTWKAPTGLPVIFRPKKAALSRPQSSCSLQAVAHHFSQEINSNSISDSPCRSIHRSTESQFIRIPRSLRRHSCEIELWTPPARAWSTLRSSRSKPSATRVS